MEGPITMSQLGDELERLEREHRARLRRSVEVDSWVSRSGKDISTNQHIDIVVHLMREDNGTEWTYTTREG